MQMRAQGWLILSAAVASFAAFAQAPDVLEFMGEAGHVNWTQGVVQATGKGRFPQGMTADEGKPLARRAAIVVAQRNLLLTMHRIAVNAQVRVERVVKEGTVGIHLAGVLSGARVIEERITEEGFYEVVMTVPLKQVGAAIAQQAPKLAKAHPGWFPKRAPKIVKPEKTDRENPPPPLPPGKGPFTGLVVDCRGLDLQPSLAPKIWDEKGREVWGTVAVKPEFAIGHGIVGYHREMNSKAVEERVGKRPLILRAVGVAGSLKADPVISEKDAEKLRSENKKNRFLEQFKVVFIL